MPKNPAAKEAVWVPVNEHSLLSPWQPDLFLLPPSHLQEAETEAPQNPCSAVRGERAISSSDYHSVPGKESDWLCLGHVLTS